MNTRIAKCQVSWMGQEASLIRTTDHSQPQLPTQFPSVERRDTAGDNEVPSGNDPDERLRGLQRFNINALAITRMRP